MANPVDRTGAGAPDVASATRSSVNAFGDAACALTTLRIGGERRGWRDAPVPRAATAAFVGSARGARGLAGHHRRCRLAGLALRAGVVAPAGPRLGAAAAKRRRVLLVAVASVLRGGPRAGWRRPRARTIRRPIRRAMVYCGGCRLAAGGEHPMSFLNLATGWRSCRCWRSHFEPAAMGPLAGARSRCSTASPAADAVRRGGGRAGRSGRAAGTGRWRRLAADGVAVLYQRDRVILGVVSPAGSTAAALRRLAGRWSDPTRSTVARSPRPPPCGTSAVPTRRSRTRFPRLVPHLILARPLTTR